jgi:lysophospholipase L1-like esterase
MLRPKIIALGDSITEGYLCASDENWVYLTSLALGWDILNLGRCGDTTGQMLSRLRRQPEAPGTYIIILGGANDAYLDVEFAEFTDNMESLVSEAQCKGMKPILALPTPVLAYTEGTLREYREWLRDFAVEQSLPLLDFYTALLVPGTEKADSRCFIDDAHPNAAGYKLMAEAAFTSLRRVLPAT